MIEIAFDLVRLVSSMLYLLRFNLGISRLLLMLVAIIKQGCRNDFGVRGTCIPKRDSTIYTRMSDAMAPISRPLRGNSAPHEIDPNIDPIGSSPVQLLSCVMHWHGDGGRFIPSHIFEDSLFGRNLAERLIYSVRDSRFRCELVA